MVSRTEEDYAQLAELDLVEPPPKGFECPLCFQVAPCSEDSSGQVVMALASFYFTELQPERITGYGLTTAPLISTITFARHALTPRSLETMHVHCATVKRMKMFGRSTVGENLRDVNGQVS